MPFDMLIEAKEFSENKLKVLSPATLQVRVLADGNELERFETNPQETIYTLKTPLTEEMQVEVTLVPGQVVAFYPVVNAL